MKTKNFYCSKLNDYKPAFHNCDAGVDTHGNRNCIDRRSREFNYTVRCFYCVNYDLKKAKVVEKAAEKTI